MTETQTPEQAAAAQVRAGAQELARQASRRRELTPDYQPPDGQPISDADIADASAAVISEWAATGRLAHLGIADDKRRRR